MRAPRRGFQVRTGGVERKRSLSAGRGSFTLGGDLEPEDPSRQVGQRLIARPRIHHEGRHLGVEGQALQVVPRFQQRSQQRLGVVQRLGHRRVGQRPDHCPEPLERHEGRPGVGGDRDSDQVGVVPHRLQGQHRTAGGGEGVSTRARPHLDVEQGLGLGLGPADLLEPLPQRAERQGVEHPPHLTRIPRREAEPLGIGGDVEVVDQARQLAIEEHLLARRGQALLEFGGLLPEVLKDPLEVSVPGDEFRCRLLPHPRHPRQVVGGVAAQCGVVRVLRGSDAVAFQNVGGVGEHGVGDPAAHVIHLDPIVHQLERVAISADHQHVPTIGCGAPRHGGDDVVGLPPRHHQLGQTQHVGHFMNQRKLAAEQVGGRFALRLVLDVALGAKCLLGAVPGDGEGVGTLVSKQLDHHRGEPVDRVGHLPRGRRQITGKRVEGAVGEVVPVEQGEGGHAGRW